MNLQSNSPQFNYRPDIDGLRAVAVSLVVAYHAFPDEIKGGFIGVDIFFIISGYLITNIILTGLSNNTFNFYDFFKRRIQRIFPSLIFVLFICYIFGWFNLMGDEFKQLGKHTAGGSGFIANYILKGESGYFDNSAYTKPLLHLWSLAVEEQFYFIWPVILWISWKKRFNPFYTCLSLILLSFWTNIYYVNSNQIASYYSPEARFWEILIASLFAVAHQHNINRDQSSFFQLKALSSLNKLMPNLLSVLGVGLITIGVLVVDKEKQFPGWLALLPTIGTILIIQSGPSALFNRKVLSNRVMIGIGLISYPLYLWHWPIFSFNYILEIAEPPVESKLIAISLSLVAAIFTYFFIEKPLKASKNLKSESYVEYSNNELYWNHWFHNVQKQWISS